VLARSRGGRIRPPVAGLGTADFVGAPLSFSTYMVCLPRSWVSYRWLKPQSPFKVDLSTYTPRGGLPDPDGVEAALDSGRNLLQGSVADGTGDPGRRLREVMK
jgi:hypothetical protein